MAKRKKASQLVRVVTPIAGGESDIIDPLRYERQRRRGHRQSLGHRHTRMHGGHEMAIVLPLQALAILQDRASEQLDGAEFVFPSDNGRCYIADPRKSWARVIKAAGTPNLHPHDLRRSLGSWQALAGSSLQIIGQSLQHRDVKSTAKRVYCLIQSAKV